MLTAETTLCVTSQQGHIECVRILLQYSVNKESDAIDIEKGQIGVGLQNTLFYKCISKIAFKTALFTFVSPLKTA